LQTRHWIQRADSRPCRPLIGYRGLTPGLADLFTGYRGLTLGLADPSLDNGYRGLTPGLAGPSLDTLHDEVQALIEAFGVLEFRIAG